MKKFSFAILSAIALLISALNSNAQCTVSNVSLTNLTIAGTSGTFDLSFKVDANSGNKWIDIHLWTLTTYPNYNYATNGSPAPKSSNITGGAANKPFASIVIDNSMITTSGTYNALVFNASYEPDNTWPIATTGTSSLVYNAATLTYSITGLTVTLPAGTNTLKMDVWSSNASQNNKAHCWTTSILPTVSGQLPTLTGSITCNTGSLVVTASNPNGSNLSATYTVYSDVNNSNTLNLSTDTVVYQSGAVMLPANGTYTSGSIVLGNAKFKKIYIVMTVPGFSITPVSATDPCLTIMPVTGMNTFHAKLNESKSQIGFTWTSQAESNNDSFFIEKSIDGRNWFTVLGVKTKAENGSSNFSIAYAYTIDLSTSISATAGLSSIFIFCLILPVLFFKGYRNRLMKPLMAIIIITSLAGVSCKKSDLLSTTFSPSGQYRLKQLDKDKNFSYSHIEAISVK